MKKSFSVGDIGSINKLQQQLVEHKNLQIIGNQVVASSQKQRLNIIKANAVLNKNRSSAAVTSSPSTLAAADSLLETIGCTIITTKTRSFSFQDNLMNEEDGEIDNPNIIDRKRLKKIQNKRRDTLGEFPDRSDPFYELGSSPPRKQQLLNKNLDKRRNKKQRITLAADLASINLSKNAAALKYFK